jgi:predicted nuclease of predicted toxin-antitoxin system
MRLLFDENLSFRLCQRLDDAFPYSTQVQLAGLAGADDRAIWDFAEAGGFVLVSLDADFAERAALLGPPPKVLWLRCGNRSTEYVEKLLRDHVEAIDAFEHNTAACLEIY